MKPYYEEPENGIVIYRGDCREILPHLEPVDLVLTDPPYPGLKGSTQITFDRGVGGRSIYKTVGTPWGEDISALADAFRLCRLGMMVFCSYHSVADIPGIVGSKPITLVSWYKRNSMPSACNVPQYETEFIWAFKRASGLNWRNLRGLYDIPFPQAGCMASERICDRHQGKAAHPAQKPIALIRELLRVGGASVLDNYLGTGTTLVAAKQLGRAAIGIEIEEKYCEIAAQRLQNISPMLEVCRDISRKGKQEAML
ncbi:MAG: site-specific DNA-methyltransferase [Syntrophales bacterium]